MVICTVPSSWSADSPDVSKESQIALNYKNIPTVSATSTVKVSAASKIRKITRKVKAKKKVTKKVKAVKRYKVKVRYFYKGKWRTKYVYRTYAPVAVSKPAPVIRDVPYWECYGPSANCQSDNADIIAKSRELSTKPNPNPRPTEPTLPLQSDYINEAAYNAAHAAWVSEEPQKPGDEPQLSDYSDEAAYNAAHAAWVSQNTEHAAWASREPQRSNYLDETAYNTAYQEYLAAKSAYDNYSPTVAVSEYEKAVNIFEDVQHGTAYSYYYNTRYGAVGTLTGRTANCCDHTHLIVALARAAGLPARYAHADCTFSGLRTGHVWAQLWVNGQWYNADAISYSNTLGTISNWNIGTMSWKGIYSSLPF